ncbi:MAG: ATP-binding protein [Bacteroidales bacterium]|nr:ATP-binding protein [Bacteroidales bacterium]
MKITRFVGKGIHGYLDFDINFNEDLNFLIGVNGSGKTTVIRLLRGLLCGAEKDLNDIDYSEIRAYIDGVDSVEYVESTKNNGQVITLPQDINPIIIGTERILQTYTKASTSSIELALKEVQENLYVIIRHNSAKLEEYGNDFRKAAFNLSFSMTDIQESNETNNEEDLLMLKKYSKLLQEDRIKIFLGEDAYRGTEDVLKTANEIQNDLSSWPPNCISEKYKNLAERWDNIKKKINRVYQTIDLADKYSKLISELKAPITRFTNSINLFFKETEKCIKVSDAGDITVHIEGSEKTNSIFELSSGEQQLIILIGHLAFKKSDVYIIDEPELSLHLAWQYSFVDALQEANPDAQYILATHASGIIAKKSREEKCIDLTRR